jgi:hypothetical protein
MTTNHNQLKAVLAALGYDDSPNFLTGGELGRDRDFGHIYRKAEAKCGLTGVYVLKGSSLRSEAADIPVVYVCRAESRTEADAIHRLVWNQNIVPFLLVACPDVLRLYAGFRYVPEAVAKGAERSRGVLQPAIDFDRVADVLNAFRAAAIDNGHLWTSWGNEVTSDSRVDWTLLENLRVLGDLLLREGLPRSLAHSLIGKFVYLHYLRARRILSDRKMRDWGLEPQELFGRNVDIEAFASLLRHLQQWLNGSVFPLSDSDLKAIGQKRLRKIAAVFLGDTAEGQIHLGFDAYDFSFIPIETISVIYEQFLHAEQIETGTSTGRQRGAYYTPLPLVNFTIDRLARRRPLQSGMRVLDPACGSGVFLVQCFRHLAEQRVAKAEEGYLRPAEVRQVLTDHIFGIDSDPDACRVSELSLILTLLDYVNPPDLRNTANFKLPALVGTNIHCGDAFDVGAQWAKELEKKKFDWIIGNPPWTEITATELAPEEKLAWQWIKGHAERMPTGGNQVAEAFAWRVRDFAKPDGQIGLVMPAMTLFKYESQAFRREFFKNNAVWSVANFANLAEVLFAGRSRVPAAVFFYSSVPDPAPSGTIEVYSPLVANQVPTAPREANTRQDSWCIVLNSSELKEIAYRDAVTGELLPWKLALWGSPLDKQLIGRVRKLFKSVGELERKGTLLLSEGLQLRNPAHGSKEPLEPREELIGKLALDMSALRRTEDRIFEFPSTALVPVKRGQHFVRKGRFKGPFAVGLGPHVLVSAARNFAVFSEEDLIVPARQIGIRHLKSNADFLKALALFLNSDFALYYQILVSPQYGIKRDVATLDAMRELPIPFDDSPQTLHPWVRLYDHIAKGAPPHDVTGTPLPRSFRPYLSQINELAFTALRIEPKYRASVEDLVNVKTALFDGKVEPRAIIHPQESEMRDYTVSLRHELDQFLGDDVAARHRVTVIYEAETGIVIVELVSTTTAVQDIRVVSANAADRESVKRIRSLLRGRYSQWVYFDRDLRIYQGSTTYIVKPMQTMHWLRSQAVADADEVIAETLQQRRTSPVQVVTA